MYDVRDCLQIYLKQSPTGCVIILLNLSLNYVELINVKFVCNRKVQGIVDGKCPRSFSALIHNQIKS